jgi:hypothetical protein
LPKFGAQSPKVGAHSPKVGAESPETLSERYAKHEPQGASPTHLKEFAASATEARHERQGQIDLKSELEKDEIALEGSAVGGVKGMSS